MFDFSGKLRGTSALVATASVIAIIASAAPASAQEQRTYDIAAQPLGTALIEFSRQSNVRVMIDPAIVDGRQAPALRGVFSVDAGIGRLLEGSGLTHTMTPSGAILVQDPNSPTPVRASDVEDGRDTVTIIGTYSHLADQNSTGTRMNADPMTLPMAVSTVDKGLIEKQQALTTGDIVANVSGASPLGVSGAFIMRGFSSGTMRNGNLSADQNSQDLPILAIERVEVVKGPEAIIAGVTAGYGGVVNVITKVPEDASGGQVTATAGSRGYYDLGTDLNYALTEDRSVLGRLIVSTQNSDETIAGFDGNSSDYFAPSLTWKLRDWGTEITAQYEHQDLRIAPDAAVFATPGSELSDDLPIRRIGPASDGNNITKGIATLILNQRIADDWDLTLRHTREKRENNSVSQLAFAGDAFGFPSPDNVLSIDFVGDGRVNSNTTKVEVRGEFETGPISHKLLLAYDYTDSEIRVGSQFSGIFNNNLATGVRTDIVNVEAFPGFTFGALLGGIPTPRQEGGLDPVEQGALILDQATWGDFIVLAGYRTLKFEPNNLAAPLPTFNEALPSLGFLYRFTPYLSTYASYSEGFRPNLGNYQIDGTTVPPETAQQFEVGLKSRLFDDRIAATVSLYNIDQRNVAVPDPANPFPVCLGGSACYISVPGVESKGIEVEVSGEIFTGLNVRASASYNEKDTGAQVSTVAYAPTVGSLWVTYNFSGDDTGWWVGSGVQARSEIEGFDPISDASNPAQTRLDVSGGYTADTWSIVLGVKNVTDERLYTMLSGQFGNGTVVQPRELYATLRHRF